jgi:hypothetical protein
MSIQQDLFGVTYYLPENRARNWGSTVRPLLIAMAKALDAQVYPNGLDVRVFFEKTSSTVTAGSTLTKVTTWHKLTAASAVSLSASTAIGDGVKDGEVLILSGTSNTNTVTVPDAANTSLNGTWVGGSGDYLVLLWDSTSSNWTEIFRNK